MKKSLLALAAMGAFAGAAQAQSSVTVYGILDVGYIGANNRVSSSAITNNGGQSKGTFNSLGTSAETSSRLGFRGTEDLGGGMSAFFTAEFQLYPTDSNLSGNTNSGLLNRQSFVGLAKKGVGKGSIGTQYTLVFNASAATDPGQHNNIVGNVIYSSASGGAAATEYDNDGAITTSFTNRTSNSLIFNSDKFAGFGLNLLYTLNSKNTTQTSATAGGNTNAEGWGVSADYTIQKFYVTAAYQSLKQQQENQTTANAQVWGNAQASGATAAGLTATSNGQNIQDNQFLAGATYDFGILKAYAQYVNRKATATANSDYYVSRSAQQIGVRGFITKTVEGWASAGNGRLRAFGQNQPTANFNGWQLGSNYWLSKRTNLYAIYGQTIFSQAATATVSGSASSSNYAVGVRHTF